MIAEKLINFLESKGVECHPFNSVLATSWTDILTSEKIPFDKTARTDILKESGNIYLVIIPAGYKLDLDRLNRCLNRQLEPVSSEEARSFMKDCEEGALPPLGDLYRYPTFIDRSFEGMDEIYFVVGQFNTILQLSGEDFMSLQTTSMRIDNLTQDVPVIRRAAEVVPDEPLCPEAALEEAGEDADEYEAVAAETVSEVVQLEVVETPSASISLDVDLQAHREGFRQRLSGIDRLPVMPHMASEILALRSNMYANASDLASVVEMDPSLAAQVVRYANSPMYGYQGKIITIQDAIARVLGYDVVMNMAMGVVLGKSLNMPANGPLGMNNFWQHAIHAAALTYRLAKRMETDNKPQPGAAYLCGLLHDFGFLVLGHLFRDDFELLSKLVTENPDKPLVELERTLLGMTHEEIGAWLSEAWNMPRAVTIAIREHHNIDYDGDYAVLANLVLVADRLLKSYDTAGGTDTDITPAILNRLGLTIDKVLEEYKSFIIERDDLDAIALQIAA